MCHIIQNAHERTINSLEENRLSTAEESKNMLTTSLIQYLAGARIYIQTVTKYFPIEIEETACMWLQIVFK